MSISRYTVEGGIKTIPQSTQQSLFTVSDTVRVYEIVGEVTTVIETAANNAKLAHYPTVGSAVDLCATEDITATPAGGYFNITGTLANKLQTCDNGTGIGQVTPLVLKAGTIKFDCDASKTGAAKWKIVYEPIAANAAITAV